jgi:hypothetical protein
VQWADGRDRSFVSNLRARFCKGVRGFSCATRTWFRPSLYDLVEPASSLTKFSAARSCSAQIDSDLISVLHSRGSAAGSGVHARGRRAALRCAPWRA